MLTDMDGDGLPDRVGIIPTEIDCNTYSVGINNGISHLMILIRL